MKKKNTEQKKKFIVPYVDLAADYQNQKNTLLPTIEDICQKGRFILREEVHNFEQEIAQYIGVPHAIGVNSGTDALFLSLKALGIGPGDEVITVAHTFVATIASIVHCGATPVLIDIQDQDGNMDPQQLKQAISSRSKAIIPVHMNGRLCNMQPILETASKFDLFIVEDAAQSIGSLYKGKMAGSFGQAGCFSFHPLKTLGCMGDGGLVSVNDSNLAEQLRLLRNHGQRTKSDISFLGFNSRLDNLQAAILLCRLKELPKLISRRREIAQYYQTELCGIKEIGLPPEPDKNGDFQDSFSSFVIRTTERDQLNNFLSKHGIETFVHWPKPLNRQGLPTLDDITLPITEKISTEVLSLPIFPAITNKQIEYVINHIKKFFR